MKSYPIVELENGNECTIIDMVEYGNKKYFSLIKINQDELSLDDEIIICIYNEINNYFEEIKNNEEYIFIQEIFKERLKEKQDINYTLKQIETNYLIKLKIVEIEGYNYILETAEGKRVSKNINFYIKNKPTLNNYIYMSKNIINEINLFQYGDIINFNDINPDEIIKIENEKEEYFLQRYYG